MRFNIFAKYFKLRFPHENRNVRYHIFILYFYLLRPTCLSNAFKYINVEHVCQMCLNIYVAKYFELRFQHGNRNVRYNIIFLYTYYSWLKCM